MTRRIQSPEGIPLIDIYLLDTATLAIILDIRQYTARFMDNTIIEMSKDIRTISTMQRRETITHFLLCKTSILNAKDATIMVIRPMNVDSKVFHEGKYLQH
jgi:hypothetical protein